VLLVPRREVLTVPGEGMVWWWSELSRSEDATSISGPSRGEDWECPLERGRERQGPKGDGSRVRGGRRELNGNVEKWALREQRICRQ
jgi:hypothetical protein